MRAFCLMALLTAVRRSSARPSRAIFKRFRLASPCACSKYGARPAPELQHFQVPVDDHSRRAEGVEQDAVRLLLHVRQARRQQRARARSPCAGRRSGRPGPKVIAGRRCVDFRA